MSNEAGEPSRVVIYTRVSTDTQGRDGVSLDTQRDDCRRFARERGWLIVHEYEDIMSGKRVDRPAYQAMLAAKRTYNAVVVWKFDRLGRDVYSVKEPNGSPVITGILAVLAANESRQISERIAPNLLRRAEAGHWVARPPYGYTFKEKALVIIPEQATIYREIVARYLEGQSLAGIAKALNTRGVPPSNGNLWFARAIRWMLTSPASAGDVLWNGKTYPGRHTPIITRAEREAVLAMLAYRTHEPNDHAPTTLLAGYITCRCGYKMSRTTLKGKWHWYRCAARHSGATCDNQRLVRLADAERYVMDLLEPLFTRSATDLVDQAVTMIRERREANGVGNERARHTRDIDQARRRLAAAREKLLDGLVTDAEYLEDRQRYQAQIDAGNAALETLAAAKVPTLGHLRAAATEIKTLADAWAIASIERRRQLLTLLAVRLRWDGVALSHTIRGDVALLLGDSKNDRNLDLLCERLPERD